MISDARGHPGAGEEAEGEDPAVVESRDVAGINAGQKDTWKMEAESWQARWGAAGRGEWCAAALGAIDELDRPEILDLGKRTGFASACAHESGGASVDVQGH